MNEEENLLDQQIITTLLYIGCFIVSILLTYNEKLILKKKPSLYDNYTSEKISIYNRIAITILTFSYLYINYRNREIAKKKGESLKLFNAQLIAAIIISIISIIVLYLTINNEDNITNIENPPL